MYNIADKMITGCKFDFAIFAILTLQIPIACFDMGESVSVISCVVSCVVSWQRKSSPTVVRLVACIIRSLTSLHHLRRRTPRNPAGLVRGFCPRDSPTP